LVPVVAVGRDARLSSPRLRDALVRGLTASGVSVEDVGICATPMLYFAAFTREVGGGVMVTGSHNPAGDNGFKITLDRQSLHGADILSLKRIIETRAWPVAPSAGLVTAVDIHTPYVDYCAAAMRLGPRRLKVVVDAGNGPTGPVAPGLLRQLGCEVIELFTEMDGRFPNHHPDPTVEANLQDLIAAVRQHGADVGVAYDGDGDRIGVVDEQGGILWGDKLMIILSRALLREVPGAAIVAEVKCSQTLFDDITHHGGRAVLAKVGHSLIKDRMKQEGALLAGEMSGHIFYRHRYFGYDDAIYTTCRLLEILSADDRPLSAFLHDVPQTFATPELRLACPDEIKFAVVERVAQRYRGVREVIDIDGVRVLWPDGWGLVRASNTGPVLVMRCEAQTEAACARIQAELTAAAEQAAGQPLALGGH
jgi:phosphomannomutase/phosphoglucomutase